MGKIQKKRKITQKLRQNEGLSNIKINRYKNDYATHRGDTVKENEEYYDYVRDQAARDQQEDDDDDENYNYYEEDYGNYDSNYQNDQPTTISKPNDRTTNKITFYIEEIKENNIKHDNNNRQNNNNYYG